MILSFLLRFIKTNIPLKIVSVLFAFIIWSYVLAGENPIRELSLPDVPVMYEGAEELEARDLMINEEQSSYVNTCLLYTSRCV